MLALISPAKKMYAPGQCMMAHSETTSPDFLNDAGVLAEKLRTVSRESFQKTMGLSDQLTDLNRERYETFRVPQPSHLTLPCLSLFAGDTYTGLESSTLSESDLVYAQKHLGILSGLYGLLRPLDLMQPYRLEMDKKLPPPLGGTLYQYWGEKITAACREWVKDHSNQTIVCLASTAYFKAVPGLDTHVPVLTCHFKEPNSDGTLRTIGLLAKRARGMMARFMIQNRLETPASLKAFDHGGYAFDASCSTDQDFVFVRKGI